MTTPHPMAMEVTIALVLGGGLMAVATIMAAWRRQHASGLAWALLAALAGALVAMGASLHRPQGGGLRAAGVQIVAVALAALAGLLPSPMREGQPERPALARTLQVAAWLALLGVPPTVGFHARVLVSRAFILAGWTWAAVLVAAANALWLIPALSAWRTPGVSVRRHHTTLALALLAAIMLLGLYPQPAIQAADALARLLGPG